MFERIARRPIWVEELARIPILLVILVRVVDGFKDGAWSLSALYTEHQLRACLTLLDYNVAALRHKIGLLLVQARHPTHSRGVPVKSLCEQLLAFVAVVEVSQNRLRPRIRGPDEWHVEVLYLSSSQVG